MYIWSCHRSQPSLMAALASIMPIRGLHSSQILNQNPSKILWLALLFLYINSMILFGIAAARVYFGIQNKISTALSNPYSVRSYLPQPLLIISLCAVCDVRPVAFWLSNDAELSCMGSPACCCLKKCNRPPTCFSDSRTLLLSWKYTSKLIISHCLSDLWISNSSATDD